MNTKEEAREGITLEVMNAWEDTPLTANAHKLANEMPWEKEVSARNRLAHAQDSLAQLAQSSFALGFHRAKRSEKNAVREFLKAAERRYPTEITGFYFKMAIEAEFNERYGEEASDE